MNVVAGFWSGAKGTEVISIPTFSYSHAQQRENDFRSATIRSGLVGYLEMTVSWSWGWSGNTGGGLTQYFFLQNSGGTTVYSSSGGGGGGTNNFTITGLDPNDSYRITMQANSSGSYFMERTAYGNITYSALVQG